MQSSTLHLSHLNLSDKKTNSQYACTLSFGLKLYNFHPQAKRETSFNQFESKQKKIYLNAKTKKLQQNHCQILLPPAIVKKQSHFKFYI